MVFDNKTIQYSISNQGEYYRIDGLVTIVNKDIIKDLYLTIYDLEDNLMGNLYYSETPEGRCNENISDYYLDQRQGILAFLNETVSEVKEYVRYDWD